MKKIGIMGTHGVGKTTLALQLAAREKINLPYLRVDILTGVARSCPLPINNDATPASQAWMYHRRIEKEIELSERVNVLVCDRTVLDVCAYSDRLGFLDNNYLVMALNWMGTYHEIYWVRPNGPPVDDGVRDVDLQFQADIDSALARWISAFNINVIEYKGGEYGDHLQLDK